jgi:hypothetical protein
MFCRYYGRYVEVTEITAEGGLTPSLPPSPAASTKAERTIHPRFSDVNILWLSFFSTR